MLQKPRLSIKGLLFMSLVVAILGWASIAQLLPSGQLPSCYGEVMSPGDTCDIYQNGHFDHTDTYEDKLQQAQSAPIAGVVLGVISLAILAAGIWMIISYRRKTTLYQEAMQRQDQSQNVNWPPRW